MERSHLDAVGAVGLLSSSARPASRGASAAALGGPCRRGHPCPRRERRDPRLPRLSGLSHAPGVRHSSRPAPLHPRRRHGGLRRPRAGAPAFRRGPWHRQRHGAGRAAGRRRFRHPVPRPDLRHHPRRWSHPGGEAGEARRDARPGLILDFPDQRAGSHHLVRRLRRRGPDTMERHCALDGVVSRARCGRRGRRRVPPGIRPPVAGLVYRPPLVRRPGRSLPKDPPPAL